MKQKKLEEAKRLYKTANADQRYVLESLFPELKESDDERIRTALIEMVHDTTGDSLWVDYNVHKEDALAWLEKQREQKPSTIDIDKMVDDYANNKERGNEEFGKPVPCMVRAYRQGLNDAIGKVVLKPAWSEEVQEEQVSEEFINALGTMLNDGLPDRYLVSEERIRKSAELLFSIARKSLKNEMQELSEEDKDMLKSIIATCELAEQDRDSSPARHLFEMQANWLKSLKERCTWKPSDEQMDALWEAYKGGEEQAALASLYSDLKKLKA